MSDKLKKFIEDNEAEFDQLPRPGHFDRFKQKQAQFTPSSKPNADSFSVWLKVAAVFVLVFGIGWLFFNLGKMQGNQEFASNAIGISENNTNELAEVEFFFDQQVVLKKKEVMLFASNNNEATNQILIELERLEVQYIELKEELAINSNNEQIINAMIENYRNRLSLLEKLLSKLKKSNTIKQKHHDNIQA